MSEETTNQTKHRLNDDFADINASYQDYCHNKQAGMDCSSIKTHIMKAVYELFNKSRYKKYIPKLSVEICGEVARCLNNYEEYDKKEYVSFSQLVWYDIVNYVINPNKAALDDDREIAFDKFKSTTKYKIYKLSKFIDLYYQERHKTPDFSNPIVFSWFKEQLNWTEKQLKLIIQYYNIQNKRDASLDDSDKPNNINNVNDD
ncbi:MAG: hypothetical protein IKP67_08770, partial [Spirochaetales bacterium]|nr:hypothetical protein [Spirochaetales bacterium]